MQDNNNYLRLTIIKLIDQCGYRCMVNDKPAFYNLCESAWEWAWNALGIEENYIYAEDFYALYDKAWAELNASLGHEPPPISMVEMFQERTEPWVYDWEDEDDDKAPTKMELSTELENYVLKVCHFYKNNDVKEGILEFNKQRNRFEIHDPAGNVVKKLKCGEIFIVEVSPGVWHIGQCDQRIIWVMLGTGLNEDLSHVHKIIYHPKQTLRKEDVGNVSFKSSDMLGPLDRSTIKKIYKQMKP